MLSWTCLNGLNTSEWVCSVFNHTDFSWQTDHKSIPEVIEHPCFKILSFGLTTCIICSVTNSTLQKATLLVWVLPWALGCVCRFLLLDKTLHLPDVSSVALRPHLFSENKLISSASQKKARLYEGRWLQKIELKAQRWPRGKNTSVCHLVSPIICVLTQWYFFLGTV